LRLAAKEHLILHREHLLITFRSRTEFRYSFESLEGVVTVKGAESIVEVGILLVDSCESIAWVAGVYHVKLLLLSRTLTVDVEVVIDKRLSFVGLKAMCVSNSCQVHRLVHLLVLHSVAESLLACYKSICETQVESAVVTLREQDSAAECKAILVRLSSDGHFQLAFRLLCHLVGFHEAEVFRAANIPLVDNMEVATNGGILRACV